ncbi:MAG: excinuclease ABC subunit UvrA [Candidatus Aminicenantes bacterium]|nr:excinuclease ABC subunit UvrA [Candidatus Aminicenantes bacterium]
MQEIEIIAAKKNNLKNISLKIPKRQLIAITGVSGSGKSTLAYDTIFQEGQRKYLESLSTYARQFIKAVEKPQVQAVRGISPTISIDQKHASFYYNSTVGTVSEVSQYLRLLFARTAVARCPGCGKNIERYSLPKILDYIFEKFAGEVVYLLAPVVKNRKGSFRALFERYIKRGFLKALIDGKLHYLDDMPPLDRNVRHNIAIQVDAVKIPPGVLSHEKEENKEKFFRGSRGAIFQKSPPGRRRQGDIKKMGAPHPQVKESAALAAFESNGEIIVLHNKQEHFFSDKLYCPACNISLKEPEPATFSINSPTAACGFCSGRGVTEENEPCPQCQGSGFKQESLSFYFKGKNVFELGEMEVTDLLEFLRRIELGSEEEKILAPILPQVLRRLESFVRLNLGYITLNRKINTLSGGELQRTRLVSQLGFGLSGVIYILDEPSIGMHMSEQENLLRILSKLKEKDNTIIVVEHDESTIRAADYVIDLGPGSGEAGGEVVYSGWFRDFHKAGNSLTADFLFRRQATPKENAGQVDDLNNQKFLRGSRGAGRISNIEGVPYDSRSPESHSPAPRAAGPPARRSQEKEFIEIKNITLNNLKNVAVKIPLSALTVVTGVSGSGKSSLIVDAFYPAVKNRIAENEITKAAARREKIASARKKKNASRDAAGLSDSGAPARILKVDQAAIGKNSRSCPATYIGLMPLIRELFTGLTEAKLRGYSQSRFSFNVSGGRCEACSGLGYRKLEMSFLPHLEVICPVCSGRRYNSETLLCKYKGLSIADVLGLTAEEAYKLFRDIPFLAKKIKVLVDVGLGYLELGQSSTTLSGGESQRIRLSKELARVSSKPTIYLLDEPTIGLHFADIRVLLDVFDALIAKSNTIVVIEHNIEIVEAADYIIDMGPGGGKNGGKILYQGELQGIFDCKESITARYLK